MPALPNNPGTASRQAAWRILLEQESHGVFLKDLFASRLKGFSPEDSDLIRNICLGVLRWKRLLDYNLSLQAERGIKDARLRMLMRIGAYQIFFLNGIPAFAAVNTAVELAKAEFGKSEAGFTNAVLKALSRHGLRNQKVKNNKDIKSLAVNTSHPDWMVERWSKVLLPEALQSMLQRNNEEAPLWIRINPRKTSVDAAAEFLRQEGVDLEPNSDTPLFLRLTYGADKALRSGLFAQGGFSFQDPVAYCVATLLDWHPGQTVLDACAAPGGKSALLLEMAVARGENISKAHIISGDAVFSRLRKIRDARERLGHKELLPVVADLHHPPFFPPTRGGARGGYFDRILLDAPCSNLGVLRRRPEARWNLTPEKTVAMAGQQSELLEKASALLAPNGRLVYATCSAEPEETIHVVNDFLSRHPEFKLDAAGENIPAALRKKGCLWIYPGETEYDGFFAAALVRAT